MRNAVLVTNGNGPLAQGVLRIIRTCGYPVSPISIGASAASGANHLCHHFYPAGASYANEHVDMAFFMEVCRAEKIKLIIPTTDHEAYLLQKQQDDLPPIACSPAHTSLTFLDKYKTALQFREYGIAFAESCLPSQYTGEFDRVVVKPRTGRLSRDVHFDPPSPTDFSDDFLIQRRLDGPELTTAFYVKKDGSLLGHITFVRSLRAGSTSECQVTKDYDSQVDQIINRMVDCFDIVGPCNFQSRVSNGLVLPFEVNCRVSGTASIRHQFGFQDVKYILEEYLFDRTPDRPVIREGCATRMLMDVIYLDQSLDDVAMGKLGLHYIF